MNEHSVGRYMFELMHAQATIPRKGRALARGEFTLNVTTAVFYDLETLSGAETPTLPEGEWQKPLN